MHLRSPCYYRYHHIDGSMHIYQTLEHVKCKLCRVAAIFWVLMFASRPNSATLLNRYLFTLIDKLPPDLDKTSSTIKQKYYQMSV